MKPLLPSLLLGLGLSIATITPAAAYPVDCAILLCLAGGWPTSAECARARTVFIRRITPWPIEPPLQIWNCPMRASFRGEDRPRARLLEVAFQAAQTPRVYSHPETPTVPLLADAKAKVDISDPAFDFLRTIRVFHIEQAYQRLSGGGSDMCTQSQRVRVGIYDEQGRFSWHRSHVEAVPSAFEGLQGWKGLQAYDQSSCPTIHLRGVFVEWRDYEGTYGHEAVHY